MADLFLNWVSLGAMGTTLADTSTGGSATTVDTGGVNVAISFEAQDTGAEAFTAAYDGYVPEGSSINPNSHLKLFGEGGDGGTVSATSTTVLDFSSSNELYTDEVQNVSFVLNDVDGGAGSDLGDLAGDATLTPGGIDFQDNVTILALRPSRGHPDRAWRQHQHQRRHRHRRGHYWLRRAGRQRACLDRRSGVAHRGGLRERRRLDAGRADFGRELLDLRRRGQRPGGRG
ncbi:hypothetical protein [Salipiger sp. PrR003]|uniref:hypothetical protein n=1 Tax=Salipiger sp. PrR003 TaxID=2706776 RepID=UPI001F3B6479|nr:hypothetical protein [Salipiger sp. PrR003]